jgi:hypothetical protein
MYGLGGVVDGALGSLVSLAEEVEVKVVVPRPKK